MPIIRPMIIEGTLVYAEVRELPEEPVSESSQASPHDLPKGAERTGAAERLAAASAGLSASLKAIAREVLVGIKEIAAEECSMELCFSLGGKANIVPILVEGSSNASIKVVLKWKNSA
jgi:hypothetical protein